jgi:hypothetical protein
MPYLSYPSATEVALRLGRQEDAILTVVRRWRSWTRADVEGHMPGDAEVTAVVLTAERGTEATIREILYRSFRIVFPTDGGEGTVVERAAAGSASRKYRSAYR